VVVAVELAVVATDADSPMCADDPHPASAAIKQTRIERRARIGQRDCCR
jgi:hypothetical protein